MIVSDHFIHLYRDLDDGLKEAVSSIIWVSLRLHSDCAELKLISDQLTAKYGKPYAMSCMDNTVGTVSTKLMQKMSVQEPPRILVERYLIEIAKNYNVDYEPDEKVLMMHYICNVTLKALDLKVLFGSCRSLMKSRILAS